MNNINYYYTLCGFLSGGLLMFIFTTYKINQLKMKINELEETKTNLLEHLMILDSSPYNLSCKKNK